MRVADKNLAEVWDQGFTVVEGFLDPTMLKDARDALWEIYPQPEEYFADPSKHTKFARSQFSGLSFFPYPSWALNRVVVYPDLVDAAERFLSAKDIEIYKVELWAKYSGAVNYDQPHHRDFGNHTLVVPRLDKRHTQMTTFILLSDVTAVDGPTKLVPLKYTKDLPLTPRERALGEFFDKEVSAQAPAGSLLIYKTDVLHRGSGGIKKVKLGSVNGIGVKQKVVTGQIGRAVRRGMRFEISRRSAQDVVPFRQGPFDQSRVHGREWHDRQVEALLNQIDQRVAAAQIQRHFGIILEEAGDDQRDEPGQPLVAIDAKPAARRHLQGAGDLIRFHQVL
jgi:hypothetical protein